MNLVALEMGGSPIFYGLSGTDDVAWKQSVNKFVALSPCILPTIPSQTLEYTTEKDEAGNDVLDPLTGEPKQSVTYEAYKG